MIQTIIEKIKDEPLRKTCEFVLRDPRFRTHPASIKHHHAYEGGLEIHTVDVVEDCILRAVPHAPHVDLDVLVTAAIWHDYAKVWDYRRLDGEWVKAPYARTIHHIHGSAMEFHHQARVWSVDPDKTEAVAHCILSHHGDAARGSIIEPQTLEALILHQADAMSALFGRRRGGL